MTKQLEQTSVKNIFRVSPQNLAMFFEKKNMKVPDNKGEIKTSLEILKECGYNEGLCQLLVSHQQTGIIGDEIDLKRRRA